MTVEEIREKTDSVKDDVVRWRRHLHENPELSFHEEKTSRFVRETLESFGSLEITNPTKTSVMARLLGNNPGKVLALRADMDALPITEENDFDFASKNEGVMHACGHDVHTATMLGVAKVLSGMKDRINGEVRFLFQHAEEVLPGGASEMVKAGVMDGVDTVLGAHVWSPLDVGKIGITYGPMMAAPDTFKVKIIGKGGHAALPNQTVDPIVIGAQVVTGFQTIVSRNVDPLDNAVLSVSKFVGGTTDNVIPGYVEMFGTVRTFDPKLRKFIPKRMEEILKGLTAAYGATYEFGYTEGYAPVINDDEVEKILEASVREVLGDGAVEMMKPNMGGEDFSAYLKKAPGAFFLIGGKNEAKGIVYPHHHPKFTVDETVIENGLSVFLNTVFKLLG